MGKTARSSATPGVGFCQRCAVRQGHERNPDRMAKPSYSDSVFINCPFDDEYLAKFRAIVFAIQDCGFAPRCTLESNDSGETRVDKLYRLITLSRFGVHDISRTQLDGTNNLPRFNMPLELGIFLGASKLGTGRQRQKKCLVLDSERYRYQQFCSDIAGQDIKAHNDEPIQVARAVRNWLHSAERERPMPTARTVAKRFQRFEDELPTFCEVLDLDIADLNENFSDLTTLIEEWLRQNSRSR